MAYYAVICVSHLIKLLASLAVEKRVFFEPVLSAKITLLLLTDIDSTGCAIWIRDPLYSYDIENSQF